MKTNLHPLKVHIYLDLTNKLLPIILVGHGENSIHSIPNLLTGAIDGVMSKLPIVFFSFKPFAFTGREICL